MLSSVVQRCLALIVAAVYFSFALQQRCDTVDAWLQRRVTISIQVVDISAVCQQLVNVFELYVVHRSIKWRRVIAIFDVDVGAIM